jgi:hypothetical protein
MAGSHFGGELTAGGTGNCRERPGAAGVAPRPHAKGSCFAKADTPTAWTLVGCEVPDEVQRGDWGDACLDGATSAGDLPTISLRPAWSSG